MKRSRSRSRSRSRNKDCIGRSRLTLRKDQRQIVKFLNTHDELLVVHGTGCGKTLSAVTASQCYLCFQMWHRVYRAFVRLMSAL